LKIILSQTGLYLKIAGFRGGAALPRVCLKEVGRVVSVSDILAIDRYYSRISV
jgi:hypothetical protein